MRNQVIPISREVLTAFSQRWQVRELALFGSILRDDFKPDSDIDVLVTFDATAEWGILAHLQMQHELEELFGRSVDLVSRRAIERSTNWFRRNSILSNAKTIYPILESSEILYAAR